MSDERIEAVARALAEYHDGDAETWEESWTGSAAFVLAVLDRLRDAQSEDPEPQMQHTERLVKRIVYFLRYEDWPDDTAADAVERVFSAGDPTENG